ncbi:MAG: P-type conjugative transfer protein TrbJ [Myxococcota bacterium]|nr:P-type conjugative transfer protein TrbJ [Myxococcota bacterium]
MSRDSRTRVSHAVVAIGLVGVVLCPPRAARSLDIVFDPRNMVHNIITAVQQTLSVAQEVQMVANQGTQIAQQVQQLQHELEMLQNMAVNTLAAPTVAWGETQAALDVLGQAVQVGLSIPYTLSDVADVFEGRFPGYVAPTDWPTAYDSWSTSALDTLRGTLASAGRNVADAPNVQAALDALRTANDSTQGRLEALQIGNQIASLQVEEMTKLRQLFAAQINAQNAYLGAQEAKAAGSAAAFDAWVGNAPQAIPVSRASEGLGTVPRP